MRRGHRASSMFAFSHWSSLCPQLPLALVYTLLCSTHFLHGWPVSSLSRFLSDQWISWQIGGLWHLSLCAPLLLNCMRWQAWLSPCLPGGPHSVLPHASPHLLCLKPIHLRPLYHTRFMETRDKTIFVFCQVYMSKTWPLSQDPRFT